MNNLDDYNNAMDGIALAIKSGAGNVFEFAESLTKSDVFCGNLIRIIQRADYDLYESAWFHWMEHGTTAKKINCIACSIVEHSLKNRILNSNE
jgi:hypothetical protein|tara:strand:+ start:862 stop:1140 length:279 start_codon:yes stop_codon:yes gene_type:complete